MNFFISFVEFPILIHLSWISRAHAIAASIDPFIFCRDGTNAAEETGGRNSERRHMFYIYLLNNI